MHKIWRILPFITIMTAASAASFDCRTAATYAEKTICAQPELSRADEQLYAVYTRVAARYGRLPEFQQYIASNYQYLNACTDPLCIKGWFVDTMYHLEHFTPRSEPSPTPVRPGITSQEPELNPSTDITTTDTTPQVPDHIQQMAKSLAPTLTIPRSEPSMPITPREDLNVEIEKMRRGCRNHDYRGCEWLMELYRLGKQLPRDPQAMAYYADQGCKHGGITGCRVLSFDYIKNAPGAAMHQNYKEAARYLNIACRELNDSLSCHHLGFLFFNGLGVRRNIRSAIDLHIAGCTAGRERRCLLREEAAACMQNDRDACSNYDREAKAVMARMGRELNPNGK